MRKGYTLVELMVVVVILGACALLCAGGIGLIVVASKGSDALEERADVSERASAEENAQDYFTFRYEPDEGTLEVSCIGTDPNGDGYTECKGEMQIEGEQHRYMADCTGNWPVNVLDKIPDEGCVSSVNLE